MTGALALSRPLSRMASVESGPTPQDEGDLVMRAKRGDVDAFESLYRAMSGRIFAVCLRMIGDRSQATEALQDVFVRVWEKLDQFKGESSFSTWVHRVCISQLLEQRRKTARREARVTTGESSDTLASHGRSTQGDMETRLDLERALPLLSAGAREVFILHDVQGYGHDEIARLLGIAESTVRVQLHRARKHLMEVLDR